MDTIIKQFNKLENIKPADEQIYKKVLDRWDGIAKPLRGLGRFEEITARIGAVLRTDDVDIRRRAAIVMCADNGIVKEGVTQSGQEVTAAVAGWMGRMESSVCRMAEIAGADIIPVDIGINMEGSPEGVINRKVRKGTDSFLTGPAMSDDDLEQAINTGIDLVRDCKNKGYTVVATGEMGIGNTTTSSAVCAALLGLDPVKVTGRGAGLDNAGLQRKIGVIKRTLILHDLINIRNVSAGEPDDGIRDKGAGLKETREYTLRVLRTVGGLDIAGLTGVFLGGALYNIPVIIDGFISAVSALAAERILPGTREVMTASHLGREGGMKYILDELKLKAVIDADMALGEGTGAVMLFPLLDAVLELYHSGLRFEDTGVDRYEHFEN